MPPTLNRPVLALWLSPHEGTYQTVDRLVQDAQQVHLPGHDTMVLIPTLYGEWPQQVLNRSIGDELAIDSTSDARIVRSMIEEQGVKCGGWSVPRGTGDPYEEGFKHGQAASAFEFFVINWEEGWDGFWAAEGADAVNRFLSGFWDALGVAGTENNILVGLTFVTNTAMLQSASAEEGAMWIEGTHYAAIEAYIPGDPGLDPELGQQRMQEELARAGHPDFPIVCILERGDLPRLCAQYSHPHLGVQVWTMGAAMQHQWPGPDQPDPGPDQPTDPEVPVDEAWQVKKDRVVQVAGEMQNLAEQLRGEAKRPQGPRRTVTRNIADEITQRAKEILA